MALRSARQMKDGAQWLYSSKDRLMAAQRPAMNRNTPCLNRRLVILAKSPAAPFSQREPWPGRGGLGPANETGAKREAWRCWRSAARSGFVRCTCGGRCSPLPMCGDKGDGHTMAHAPGAHANAKGNPQQDSSVLINPSGMRKWRCAAALACNL